MVLPLNPNSAPKALYHNQARYELTEGAAEPGDRHRVPKRRGTRWPRGLIAESAGKQSSMSRFRVTGLG